MLLRVMLLLFILLLLSLPVAAEDTSPWPPSDDKLRILEMRYSKYTFDELLGAYQHNDMILLPITELSSLIDIAIEVEEGVASGFVIREDHTLILDTSRNEIVLKGVTSSYDPDKVKELYGEIYVEFNLLGKWFGITFDINLFSSLLTIKSTTKLPFLSRIEREERMRKQDARKRLKNVYYPRHQEPYGMLSIPFIDQTLSVGQKGGSGPADTTWRYTTYLTADFLNLESQMFVSGMTDDSVEDFRFTFGKKDPSGDLLGFLRATQYHFGNVTEPRVDLVTQTTGFEHGLTLSNFPLDRQTEYDRHRFQGELLPGWEVELYHNNRLMRYQTAPIEGLYDFRDVPLLFGDNYFRMIFYGPQGQIREETQRFQLNETLTRKGEFYYNLSATKDEKSGHRVNALADYGFARNMSASVNLVSIPIHTRSTTEQHNYIRSALSLSLRSFFVTASIIHDRKSGEAFEVDSQGRIGNNLLRFNHIQLNDFVSEEFKPDQRAISQRSRVNFNTSFSPSWLAWLPRIPIGLEVKRDRFETGEETLQVTSQLSLSIKGIALNNQLTTQRSDNQARQTTGNLQGSLRLKRLLIRGSLSYQTKPKSELNNALVTINPGFITGYRVNFGVNHSLSQGTTEISASIRKQSDKYDLSVISSYNSDHEVRLELNFSVGFGHEPREQRWRSNANSIANLGSLSARVFLDTNQDGIFGENDEPLQNVGFRLNGGSSKLLTDANGISFLTGLPPAKPLDLVIETASLEDPYWTPALTGVQVVPRPGRTIQLDFPIFLSGEIDGTVFSERRGKLQGLNKVLVELVDEHDRVLQTTETAYDGFYILMAVPLGTYQIRVASHQLEGTGLRQLSVEKIEVSSEELFISGIDLTLGSHQEASQMLASPERTRDAQVQDIFSPARTAPLRPLDIEPIAPNDFEMLLSKTVFLFERPSVSTSRGNSGVRENAVFYFQ